MEELKATQPACRGVVIEAEMDKTMGR